MAPCVLYTGRPRRPNVVVYPHEMADALERIVSLRYQLTNLRTTIAQ